MKLSEQGRGISVASLSELRNYEIQGTFKGNYPCLLEMTNRTIIV